MLDHEKICVEMPLPKEVHSLKEIFTDFGGKLYVVGGSVRDFWYSVEKGHSFQPKDFDLVTDLHPDKVIGLIEDAVRVKKLKSCTKIREVGKSFGVVLVTVGGKDYEIATFREDAKSGDGRRPDHVTFSTIDKDAERRDLTINALYYDMEEKCIIDFFGGMRDICSGKIRFVGKDEERINEDVLRILRFARFYCRSNTDMGNLQKDTMSVIRRTWLRPRISEERIRDEFLKGLASTISVQFYLDFLSELGLLGQIFPNLKLTTNFIAGESCAESVIAQILRYNLPDEVRRSLFDLRYTAQEVADVSFLVNIPLWVADEHFVDFKKAAKRCSLAPGVIERYAFVFGDPIIRVMLKAPYPTVNGDIVMSETGLQGKALGNELLRREVQNFVNFLEAF